MNSALIVSHSKKSADFLKDMLLQASVSDIITVTNAGDARRLFIENDFDLCVINSPLTDEFGESLAKNIAEKGISEVILIVKAEHFDEISEKVEDYGIITVSKPVGRTFLWNAVKLAQATHKKLHAMQSVNKKLVRKIEDIRIVDRAKCILISHLSMTEPQAHRYIEKQAMDMRMTRKAVAEKILTTYEN